MGYKALGFLVWQGGKWYARRKFSGTGSTVAAAALGVAVAAGLVVLGRQATRED